MQPPSFDDIRPILADAVRRSARREAALGAFLAVLLAVPALIFAWLFASKPTVVSGGCGAIWLFGVAGAIAYTTSRLKLYRAPDGAPFAELLAAPAQVSAIFAQHVTYRASVARLGAEHILRVSDGTRGAYCRLDAQAHQQLMTYLRHHAPEAWARWRAELAAVDAAAEVGSDLSDTSGTT